MRRFLPNNSLKRTGDSATEAREERYWDRGIGFEGAVPGRSLVPAAQAQAARSRYAAEDFAVA